MGLDPEGDRLEPLDPVCSSCGEEGAEINECPKSRRTCGHHCNCSWSQDECCWCGKEFGEINGQ